MKVNNLSDKPSGLAPTGKPTERPSAAKTGAAQPEAPVSGGVTVSLSPVTQTMTNGVARSGTDVFDTEKVQAMRTAIENGSFSVNSEAVAEKMLTNAREMLGVASAN